MLFESFISSMSSLQFWFNNFCNEGGTLSTIEALPSVKLWKSFLWSNKCIFFTKLNLFIYNDSKQTLMEFYNQYLLSSISLKETANTLTSTISKTCTTVHFVSANHSIHYRSKTIFFLTSCP